MSLADACDELLSSGLLQHEYGVPTLWPRTAPSVQKADLETEYYDMNRQLGHTVNRLVYLNKTAELRHTDPQTIGEMYSEALESAPFAHMSFREKEHHLRAMAQFKTVDLTADFLTSALPTLRAIYQENSALTDAEFTILNNLKKLYSHYNEHPANIRRLLGAYNGQKPGMSEELDLQKQIQDVLVDDLGPSLAELETLNNEYLALQNTYENALRARDSTSSEGQVKLLKRASLTLARRLQRLATLCELLPNLVLCQASNWYTDKALLAVVEECQETGEKLEDFPETASLRSVDAIVKTDLNLSL